MDEGVQFLIANNAVGSAVASIIAAIAAFVILRFVIFANSAKENESQPSKNIDQKSGLKTIASYFGAAVIGVFSFSVLVLSTPSAQRLHTPSQNRVVDPLARNSHGAALRVDIQGSDRVPNFTELGAARSVELLTDMLEGRSAVRLRRGELVTYLVPADAFERALSQYGGWVRQEVVFRDTRRSRADQETQGYWFVQLGLPRLNIVVPLSAYIDGNAFCIEHTDRPEIWLHRSVLNENDRDIRTIRMNQNVSEVGQILKNSLSAEWTARSALAPTTCSVFMETSENAIYMTEQAFLPDGTTLNQFSQSSILIEREIFILESISPDEAIEDIFSNIN